MRDAKKSMKSLGELKSSHITRLTNKVIKDSSSIKRDISRCRADAVEKTEVLKLKLLAIQKTELAYLKSVENWWERLMLIRGGIKSKCKECHTHHK